MNRHHAKAGVPQKTRVIGFRITDYEHQKIIEAQQALRSLVIIGTTSDTLRSILKNFNVESWLDDASKTLRRT
jgi:hypothetical protein